MKKYDVHVEYANAPATDVADAEDVINYDNDILIVKGNRKYYCNKTMMACLIVTEKEDANEHE